MTDTAALLKQRYGLDMQCTEPLNPIVECMLKHRSCRSYKKKDVSNDTLNLLLACAQSAPTKSNLQQYSIVLIRNPAMRTRIAELIPSLSPWFEVAPIFLCFLGDVRRIRRLAEKRGHNYANNNADTFMNASIDAALAMQNFIVAAESMGLGTCPISMVRDQIADFALILEIPNGVFPIAGLTLGWPDRKNTVTCRLPPSIVVNHETYDDSSLDTDIENYDDRAHKLKPIKPQSQRHIDHYGVLEKCTWSENVSRQLSVPERPNFIDFLTSQEIELK